MAPLPAIIKLKKKHCFRLILDESISIGTVGSTGRGVTEFFNIPVNDVDVICGNLENAFAAYG